MTRIELYKDKRKEWRWRLIHKNGRTLADSGEGYKRRAMCKRMVCRVALLMLRTRFVELP